MALDVDVIPGTSISSIGLYAMGTSIRDLGAGWINLARRALSASTIGGPWSFEGISRGATMLVRYLPFQADLLRTLNAPPERS